MPLIIKLNAPDKGDDPENRYDCDLCMDVPPAQGRIFLITNLDNDIVLKLCSDCVESTLLEWYETKLQDTADAASSTEEEVDRAMTYYQECELNDEDNPDCDDYWDWEG